MANDLMIARPNTLLTPTLLSEKVILCCGEDGQAVLNSMKAVGLTSPSYTHDFRSYKIWKYEDLTIILAAIGTGPLEPLLHEMLSFQICKKIVLIGTAGRTPQSPTQVGEVYVIDKAYLSGTPLDREIDDQPLSPIFVGADIYPTASIVSTDFFYGFSESDKDDSYPSRLKKLKLDVKDKLSKADLVDMEVGSSTLFAD